MLKWLRSAGDRARLDQEMARIGVGPSALPGAMRSALVEVVQRDVDDVRKLQNPPTSEFQAFFDKAFELAAAVPSVVGTTRDLAASVVGVAGYRYIIECIADKSCSSHAPLVRDLSQVCKQWIKHPIHDFEEAVRARSNEQKTEST